MASTFRLDSHKYEGRYMYLQCKQTKNVSNNTSTIDWTLTVTGGSAGYYTTGPTTVTINGVTVYSKSKTYWNTYAFPAAKGSVSGSTTVKHDDAGKAKISLSIKTNIYTGVLKTSSDTWTLDSIERFATLTSAPNFNDEENPVIKYSNPAGSKVTALKACISLDGSNADIAYRDLDPTGTSYTFKLTTKERNVLRSATVGSNSRKVLFYVRSYFGDTNKASILERTLTIINANPTIEPTIVDTNSKSTKLTGDSSKLIRYISNAKVTINASAVKGAGLSSSKVTCGDKTLTADGTIKAVTTNVFKFTAIDNRNNATTKTIKPDIVNYVKISCTLTKNMPDVDGNLVIKATGNYFNGSFGAKNNALNVYYRYKKSGESWADDSWILIPTKNISLTSTRYTASVNISGLDYQTRYTVETYAKDVVSSSKVSSATIIAAPVFDWGRDDFKFNVPVYDQYGVTLSCGIAEPFAAGAEYRDPNITLDEVFLTAHENGPKGLGKYYLVRNLFYKSREVSSSRTQIAYPYHSTNAMYYRSFNRNDSMWSDWIPLMSGNTHKMDVLWENSDLSSTFPGQKITPVKSISGYDGVIVLYKNSKDSSVFLSSGFLERGHSSMLTYSTTDGTETYSRSFTVSSDYIDFNGGRSNTTSSDTVIIPYKIYGIKGVAK